MTAASVSSGDLVLRADVLVAGAAGSGDTLVLTAPISFWGGVDPKTGAIIDARHPQRGDNVAGKVLFLPDTFGSSSASAVLLELVRAGLAPSAIVMHEPDAILLLGLIVAREMGWLVPVAVKMDRESHLRFVGRQAVVTADDAVRLQI